jgi:hypothetical protein
MTLAFIDFLDNLSQGYAYPFSTLLKTEINENVMFISTGGRSRIKCGSWQRGTVENIRNFKKPPVALEASR